jgi:hypothetical protein
MAGLDPSPRGRPKAKYNGRAPALEDRAPERFAVGRNRDVWLIGCAGRPFPGSVWIFLDRRNFAPESPKTRVGFPWISLDSLVRIETFQWVTRYTLRKKFRAPLALRQRGGTGAGVLTMQKRSVFHRASLTRFLLFCNQLLATLNAADRNCCVAQTGRFVGSYGLRFGIRGFPNIGGNARSIAQPLISPPKCDPPPMFHKPIRQQLVRDLQHSGTRVRYPVDIHVKARAVAEIALGRITR